MSYKKQIEWLKKNHFAFNISDLESESVSRQLDNGEGYQLDNMFRFTLNTGDTFMPVEVNQKTFVKQLDEGGNAPYKIKEVIRFDNKTFKSEKVKIDGDAVDWESSPDKKIDDGYEITGNVPDSLLVLIDRVVAQIDNEKGFFLSGDDYDNFQNKIKKAAPNGPSIEEERNSFAYTINMIKNDYEDYQSLDKDMIKDFIDDEIKLLSGMTNDKEATASIQSALKLARKLYYREEGDFSPDTVLDELEAAITTSFDLIEQSVSSVGLSTEDRARFYREMQVESALKRLESEVTKGVSLINEFDEWEAEVTKFMDNYKSVYKKAVGPEGGTSEQQIKYKKNIDHFDATMAKKKSAIRTTKANIDNCKAQLRDVEGLVSGKTLIRMRLVPPELFDIVMDAQDEALHGFDRKLQADLNQALVNANDPQALIGLIQKFSSEDQDSIVYYAMNNSAEKIDLLLKHANDDRPLDNDVELAS